MGEHSSRTSFTLVHYRKMNSFLDCYRSKKVFITGHTGFKGSWLSHWLLNLGAEVYGYALEPNTDPSLFMQLRLDGQVRHKVADIRDYEKLLSSIKKIQPDIIFHLAAQPLVRLSYQLPLDTLNTNIMGTANLLEGVRQAAFPCAMVVITSDKCYENREWNYGYRESDPMGGYDPYSMSKASAELVISSWRKSFFNPGKIKYHGIRVASARAGNIIGGGDWALDRIVPDCIRSLWEGKTIAVRNPKSTRPWQHVLEPLGGYLKLGAALMGAYGKEMSRYCDAFNFGPFVTNNKDVETLVSELISQWGSGEWKHVSTPEELHEASLLNLSIDKAYHTLGWAPKLDFKDAVKETVEWYRIAIEQPKRIREITSNQMEKYQDLLLSTS